MNEVFQFQIQNRYNLLSVYHLLAQYLKEGKIYPTKAKIYKNKY